MSKQLSATRVARYERDGRFFPVAAIAVLLSLLVAGCADSGSSSSDQDKHGVFYGGVSGGRTWP